MEVVILPFLTKKAQNAGVIVKQRTPDQSDDSQDYDSGDSGIESCAQDLLNAIQAQDVKGVAQALKDVFEILESQPHEEGEHTDESSEEQP